MNINNGFALNEGTSQYIQTHLEYIYHAYNDDVEMNYEHILK